jgi:hypothetical protein
MIGGRMSMTISAENNVAQNVYNNELLDELY